MTEIGNAPLACHTPVPYDEAVEGIELDTARAQDWVTRFEIIRLSGAAFRLALSTQPSQERMHPFSDAIVPGTNGSISRWFRSRFRTGSVPPMTEREALYPGTDFRLRFEAPTLQK